MGLILFFCGLAYQRKNIDPLKQIVHVQTVNYGHVSHIHLRFKKDKLTDIKENRHGAVRTRSGKVRYSFPTIFLISPPSCVTPFAQNHNMCGRGHYLCGNYERDIIDFNSHELHMALLITMKCNNILFEKVLLGGIDVSETRYDASFQGQSNPCSFGWNYQFPPSVKWENKMNIESTTNPRKQLLFLTA